MKFFDMFKPSPYSKNDFAETNRVSNEVYQGLQIGNISYMEALQKLSKVVGPHCASGALKQLQTNIKFEKVKESFNV
jgi:hypothetical protein